mmetsp:Transcript_17222/g.30371  ORF Transcript_17222/g.30371 Transcript_17222/m.30371 type:complete len:212 (+) Transcript_17222:134-769(+)|eukprot:CAMPEP_0184522790 /NCGR_PEP_ID=MMETSP0198_2-20121128/8485_1 /TAXON_ID=1112570 /ORGANISM="Thraustochytrium sp., Strain LLF1b" /LENGTH=211 /DNA_ID=CAMNT_0026913671 /DNA_START=118 /DNA_END=753 /DNA_ORIENTATION=+
MMRRAGSVLARGAMQQQRRALSAAATNDVELPLTLFGLPARYANAVFVSASRAQELPKVEEDVKTIQKWIEESNEFNAYIANPVISRADKAADMDKLSKGMCDSTRGLLAALAENGRLTEINGVIKTFGELMGAKRGVVEATVTAAEKLTSKQQSALQKAITSGYLEKGQSLNMKVKVDSSIIGGLQVQIGDRFLDLSIQSEINSVSKALA